MLERQKELGFRPEFTGGLEAKRLRSWHVDLLADLRPKQMFFAYDTPDDLEPLIAAGKMLKEAQISLAGMRCYVLIGWPMDTISEAEKRLNATIDAGFIPCAMLYRDGWGSAEQEWRAFQREWARPAAMRKRINQRRMYT